MAQLKLHLRLFTVLLLVLGFTQLSAVRHRWSSERARMTSWEGLYLSGQVGGVWNKASFEFENPNYFNTLGPQLVGSHFDFAPNGFIGGGSVGYNYQCGTFVLGFEGGAQGCNLNETKPSPFFPDIDTYSYHLHWIASAKARAGYCYDRFLGFITAGWAGGSLDLEFKDTAANVVSKADKWVNGWTVGLGVDYKAWSCISVGLAYDYIRLAYDHESCSCDHCGTGVGFGAPKVASTIQAHALTVRLSYHL